MKSFQVKLCLLTIIFGCISCHTNDIDMTDCIEVSSEGYSLKEVFFKVDISGLPEEMSTSDLHIITLSDSCLQLDGNGEVRAWIYNGELPQIIFVSDTRGRIVYMSRGVYDKKSHNTIDAKSTAMAATTMHPSISGVKSHVYSQLTNLIEKSMNFPRLVESINKLVKDTGSIEGFSDSDVLSNLNAVLEEVLTNSTGGESLDEIPYIESDISNDQDNEESDAASPRSRAPELKGITSITGIDVGPFHVYTDNLTLVVENYSLTPLYEGTVTHHSQIERFDIPSGGDRGVTFFFDNSWGSEKKEYSFVGKADGEYLFHFDSTTPASMMDQIAHTIANVLEILGLPLSARNIFKLSSDIAIYAVSQTPGLLNLFIIPPKNAMEFVVALIPPIISYLGTSMFQEFLISRGLEMAAAQAVVAVAKRVALVVSIYQAVRGAANALLRIIMRNESPDYVDFCVCLYDGELTTCTSAEIYIEGGNDQKCIPGQSLLERLKVKVVTIGDNGEVVEGSNFHRVEFLPLDDKCGHVTQTRVKADNEGFAYTEWFLDPSNTETQYVKAHVIDVVTNTPISDDVIFKASLTDRAEVIFTLKWSKTETYTDIDLHIYDPEGHHIWYSDMDCVCGGYLDRDDTHGPGPEHIYFNTPKPGNYKVYVHHYESESKGNIGFTVETVYGDKRYLNTGSVKYHEKKYIGTLKVENEFAGSRSVEFVPANEMERRDTILLPESLPAKSY